MLVACLALLLRSSPAPPAEAVAEATPLTPPTLLITPLAPWLVTNEAVAAAEPGLEKAEAAPPRDTSREHARAAAAAAWKTAVAEPVPLGEVARGWGGAWTKEGCCLCSSRGRGGSLLSPIARRTCG